MYVTAAEHADAVGAVHGELYGDIRPAATMVIVAGLLDPRSGGRGRSRGRARPVGLIAPVVRVRLRPPLFHTAPDPDPPVP